MVRWWRWQAHELWPALPLYDAWKDIMSKKAFFAHPLQILSLSSSTSLTLFFGPSSINLIGLA